MAEMAILLGDSGFARYTKADIFEWICAAQREIVLLKPDAYSQYNNAQLAEGTKQAITSGHHRILKVIRNMGVDGSTEGAVPRFIKMDELDQIYPDWHTATANATVELWTFNPDDPTNFYVFPPQPAASQGYIDYLTSKSPPDPTSCGAAYDECTLTLDDIYFNAIFEYSMAQAHRVNAPNSLYGLQNSITHYNQFLALIGRKDLVDVNKLPEELTEPAPR